MTQYYIGRIKYDLWPNVGDEVYVVLIEAKNKQQAERKLLNEESNVPKETALGGAIKLPAHIKGRSLAFLGDAQRNGSVNLVKKLSFESFEI